jgi:hypothetical protein
MPIICGKISVFLIKTIPPEPLILRETLSLFVVSA